MIAHVQQLDVKQYFVQGFGIPVVGLGIRFSDSDAQHGGLDS